MADEVEKPKPKAKRPAHRPKGRKNGEKHSRILSLRAKGYTHAEIAKAVDSDGAHVGRVLQKWAQRLPNLANTNEFRDVRSRVLTAGHEKVLEFITRDATLERARPGELAKIADVVYRQERLERDLSTDNKAIIQHTRIILPANDVPPADVQPPVIARMLK